ncbi:hypothetical protein [Immundisolibacter sp.]|uniref:hypothetical protein n=1 Tax=Immundisolibacter sp. TaxID=1934948 RepID=UPI0035655C08
MQAKEQTLATHRKVWATPRCEALHLAHTAGGNPGGADSHANNTSNAGCNPNAICS